MISTMNAAPPTVPAMMSRVVVEEEPEPESEFERVVGILVVN